MLLVQSQLTITHPFVDRKDCTNWGQAVDVGGAVQWIETHYVFSLSVGDRNTQKHKALSGAPQNTQRNVRKLTPSAHKPLLFRLLTLHKSSYRVP